MAIPELANIRNFCWITLILFVIITGRYFLLAGIFHLVFYKWKKEKWASQKINSQPYSPKQFRREVKWSMITGFLFALTGTLTLLLWQNGYTAVYTDIAKYGWWYMPASLLISMSFHELYYYWTHRWMHIPSVFRIMHKVHHDSKISSPWTAFSFHPLEGLVQAIILPLIIIILPLHPAVIIVQLIIMSVSSVINHLDIEIYPQGHQKHPFFKWIIGATHHAQHHKRYKYNFGLYFTFLDKLHRTEK